MSFDWSTIKPNRLFAAAMQIGFDCERCGSCCKEVVGIALNSIDTKRMADYIGMDKTDFIREYTVASPNKPTDRWYKQGNDGKCPFLGETGCTQHGGRGQVCRFYPFFSPRAIQHMDDTGKATFFINCHGMLNTYLEVFTMAQYMPFDVAHEVIGGPIGKICFTYMVIDEGKDGIAKRMADSLGYANLPGREDMKELALEYGAAYSVLMGPRKLELAMAELLQYV